MTGDTMEPLVSQTFRHCLDVYKIMDEDADNHYPDDPNGGSMRVWEGFFTKLIVDRMGLSVPYYSSIRSNLMRMGCIRQLRRGGGSSPSQWELLREPTEELWNSSPAKRSYATSKQEAAFGQLADIVRRVSRLEENVDVLAKAFAATGGEVPFDEPAHSDHERTYEVIKE